MNTYKSKSVTLRTKTHTKLFELSKKIVPGYELSIPNTIEKLVNEHNGSNDSKNEGTINVQKTKEA